MKEINFGISKINENGPAYFIAEIGHNHQGDLETALKMIKVASFYGVQAVKFQKRDNRKLYTKKYYERPYDNENSYGKTYGEHREFLEFGWDEYVELKKCAAENKVEFFSTAFDFESVDFLEKLNVPAYKLASADVTNIPLIKYIAALKKPIFLSTGAATLEEIRMAYECILKYHSYLCIMHCTAGYPTEYKDLNLNIITTLKKEFPEAVIGYSGHDNGILASTLAYMLGAIVIEKHFTLNHALKGTDHKFSLEPIGLSKQIRDLQRVDQALGKSEKVIENFELPAREKMGKSLYTSCSLTAGTVLKEKHVAIKTPGGFLPPYYLEKIIGKKIKKAYGEEAPIMLEDLE